MSVCYRHPEFLVDRDQIRHSRLIRKSLIVQKNPNNNNNNKKMMRNILLVTQCIEGKLTNVFTNTVFMT